jgi:hypothetical protein
MDRTIKNGILHVDNASMTTLPPIFAPVARELRSRSRTWFPTSSSITTGAEARRSRSLRSRSRSIGGGPVYLYGRRKSREEGFCVRAAHRSLVRPARPGLQAAALILANAASSLSFNSPSVHSSPSLLMRSSAERPPLRNSSERVLP